MINYGDVSHRSLTSLFLVLSPSSNAQKQFYSLKFEHAPKILTYEMTSAESVDTLSETQALKGEKLSLEPKVKKIVEN